MNDPINFFEWVTGYKPYDYQAKFLKCKDKRIAFRSGRQVGKCLYIKEYVYTPSGIKQVSEIKEGDKILGGKVKGLHCFEDEIFKITFANGISIRVNGEHPFWSIKSPSNKNSKINPQWLSAQELRKEKFHVFFSDNNNSELSNFSIDKKTAKLLGYLLSDGYWGKRQTLKFTNNNKIFIKEVKSIAKKMGFYISECRKNNGYDIFLKAFEKQGDNGKKESWWRDSFRSLGIYDKKSFGKLQSLDKESLKEFIRGYFNGDGYLWIKKRKKRISRIEIGFAIGKSKRRAYEFQYMLWRLGIHSLVKEEWHEKSKNLFYRILITQRTEVTEILKWIEDTRYPEKFNLAKQFIKKENQRFKRFLPDKNGRWIAIRKIEKIGKRKVCGWTTDTHEIISYLGMKTHNTTVCAVKALHKAFWKKDQQILIIAPVIKQSKLLFQMIKDCIEKTPEIKKTLIKDTATELFFDCGSKIYCLSGNKLSTDRIRGFSPHLLIIDEAAFVADETFEAAEPSVLHTRGAIFLISTPYGKRGFFYDAFSPDSGYTTFHVKSEECPRITKRMLDKIRPRKTENQYIQEYEGEFTEEGDAYFKRELIARCIGDIKQIDIPEEERKYYLGVDCARKGNDETCYIIRDDMGEVKKILSDKMQDTNVVIGKIKYLNEIFKFQVINIDDAGTGGAVCDILYKEQFPIVGHIFSLVGKEHIYRNLKVLMEHNKIKFPKNEKLINQMGNLITSYTIQGARIQPPLGNHDDYCDSLALAFKDMELEKEQEEEFFIIS